MVVAVVVVVCAAAAAGCAPRSARALVREEAHLLRKLPLS